MKEGVWWVLKVASNSSVCTYFSENSDNRIEQALLFLEAMGFEHDFDLKTKT